MPKVAQQARQGRTERESGLTSPDRRGVKMWVAPFPPISPLSNQAPNGCRGRGRGLGKQSCEKTSRFVHHSKKRLRSPAPFLPSVQSNYSSSQPQSIQAPVGAVYPSSFVILSIPHKPPRQPGGPSQWPRTPLHQHPSWHSGSFPTALKATACSCAAQGSPKKGRGPGYEPLLRK